MQMNPYFLLQEETKQALIHALVEYRNTLQMHLTERVAPAESLQEMDMEMHTVKEQIALLRCITKEPGFISRVMIKGFII